MSVCAWVCVCVCVCGCVCLCLIPILLTKWGPFFFAKGCLTPGTGVRVVCGRACTQFTCCTWPGSHVTQRNLPPSHLYPRDLCSFTPMVQGRVIEWRWPYSLLLRPHGIISKNDFCSVQEAISNFDLKCCCDETRDCGVLWRPPTAWLTPLDCKQLSSTAETNGSQIRHSITLNPTQL